MKKIIIIIILVIILGFVIFVFYPAIKMELIRSKIPDNILVNLYQGNYEAKMEAIKKLGELKTDEAVEVLYDFFRKKPDPSIAIDSKSPTKKEALKAMGKTKKENAKKYLKNILANYIDKFARGKELEPEYAGIGGIIVSALEGISNFDDEDEIINLFKNYSDDASLDDGVREYSFRYYIQALFKKNKNWSLKDKINYLLNTPDGFYLHQKEIFPIPGKMSTPAIKFTIISENMISFGEPALPYLFEYYKKLTSTDEKKRLRIIEMMAQIEFKAYAKNKYRTLSDLDKEILNTIINYWAKMPKVESFGDHQKITDSLKYIEKYCKDEEIVKKIEENLPQ